jgi:integrase
VRDYIKPAIGRQRLGNLSTQHVRQLRRSILDRGLSSTTARYAHRVLSIALNDAVREGRVPRNIVSLVPAPSKAVSKRAALTAEEAIQVLHVAADHRLGSRWLAALLLGVRQGERIGLRWSMLDLDAGIADISWSLQRVTYDHGCVRQGHEPVCGKKRGASCPTRRLPIPDGMEHKVLDGNLVLLRPKSDESIRIVALIEPLRLALLRRREEVRHERASYDVDHDLVWCRSDGRPLDPRDDWADWKALLIEAGVRHVTGHETRHTTATLLLELGIAPRVVQELLGHSDMVSTKGYQHVSLALQREALGALGQLLELTAAGAGA